MTTTTTPDVLGPARGEAGHWIRDGKSHRFSIERLGRGQWALLVYRLREEFGIKLIDRGHRPGFAETETYAEAEAIAREFEALGDDYASHEHGYAERLTTAICRTYEAMAR